MHRSAVIEHLHLLLDPFEVLSNFVNYSFLDFIVLIRSLDNLGKLWLGVSDESMNELVEVLVVHDRLGVRCDFLHVRHQLVQLGSEVHLSRREAYVLLIESNCRLDGVLAVAEVHLRQDELCTLLIESDLCLHDHVVNEANEMAQGLKVGECKPDNSVLKSLFLLHLDHGLVLLALTHLGAVKIFLVTQFSTLCNILHKGSKLLVDNFINLLDVCYLIGVTMIFLLKDELFKLICLLESHNFKGLLGSHFLKNLVNLEEGASEIWPCPD